MKKKSKRYREMVAAVGEEALKESHPIPEAVALMKKTATAKFNESVELVIHLNVDPRKSDQLVRGSYSLPHGTGKTMRVIAFAEGEAAEAAKAAGAIEVGGEELAKKIQDGWLDFDIAIAHPSMMRYVGALGKMLGPKGLMPSPKSGTVTDRVADAVGEFAAGKIEFRTDQQANIAVCVGQAGFEEEKIAENIKSIINHINSMRPAVVKGNFMLSAKLSSTMGLGFALAI
ncbi:MAG: 50S ribosomal protein L1 [Planctomycetes bacterium]|nr:50S ribosomal protein L1 [Planctomycetota bacterium]